MPLWPAALIQSQALENGVMTNIMGGIVSYIAILDEVVSNLRSPYIMTIQSLLCDSTLD